MSVNWNVRKNSCINRHRRLHLRLRLIQGLILLLAVGFVVSSSSVPAIAAEPEIAAEPQKDLTRSIEPTKLALIEEVLNLANLDNTIDRMWTACLKKISGDIYKLSCRDFTANTTLSTAEQEEKARAQTRKLMENLSARFKDEYYRSYRAIYRDIYDQFFSQEDLIAMKTFFGSSAGRKSKEIMPRMIKEMVGELKESVNPRIKSCLRKRLEEMEAARAKEAEESKI